MRRRLLNIAACLSLVVRIATAAVWVRSYFVADIVSVTVSQRDGLITTDAGYALQGVVVIYQFTRPHAGTRESPGLNWSHQPAASMRPQTGYRPFWIVFGPSPIRWGVRCAYWFVLVLALILPAIWMRGQIHRARRRRREISNLCPTCGYDLRAHHAGDRCPECGMVPTPRGSMAAIEDASIKPRRRRLAAAGGCDQLSMGAQSCAQ